MRTSEQQESSVAPPISDAELVDLRLRYEAAYDAYQASVFALQQACRPGDEPAPQLLTRHAETLPRSFLPTILISGGAGHAAMAHELQSSGPWGSRSKQPG